MPIKIHIFHTGTVHVSKALPFKDAANNPSPFQLSSLSPYGRKNRVWLPVSSYLIEHPRGKILVDTGWHREISPNGKYNRLAQIKHMGIGHFLINQGMLPTGESIVEQLSDKMGISPKDLDFVILTHLHTDHASGLRMLNDAKHIMASEEEIRDTKEYPIRYVKSMWKGVSFEPFGFSDTGVGPVGKSYDLFDDGSVELIQIPGHTSGLTAVKINAGDKYVLLFSDGGYASKSWKEMVPPGTALDEKQALNSLKWIRDMSLNENCVESLANHDADIVPHTVELEQV